MSASLLAVDRGRRPRFGLVVPLLAVVALLSACQREVEQPVVSKPQLAVQPSVPIVKPRLTQPGQ